MCEQIFGAESGRNSSVRQKQPSAACERMFGPKRGPLAGLVVFVDVVTSDGLDASPVFARRVASLGGDVAPRLAARVTHAVFQGGADGLRALHDRCARLGRATPPPVLAVTWLAAVAAAGALVPAGAHALQRPKDTLASLVRTSSPAFAASASAKKRKVVRPVQPDAFVGAPRPLLLQNALRNKLSPLTSVVLTRSARVAAEPDVDDPLFSSTQQLAKAGSPSADASPPSVRNTPAPRRITPWTRAC